jgi:hypothetical protein
LESGTTVPACGNGALSEDVIHCLSMWRNIILPFAVEIYILQLIFCKHFKNGSVRNQQQT